MRELRRLGCKLAQGYYFSMPLTAGQILDLFDNGMKLARPRALASVAAR